MIPLLPNPVTRLCTKFTDGGQGNKLKEFGETGKTLVEKGGIRVNALWKEFLRKKVQLQDQNSQHGDKN